MEKNISKINYYQDLNSNNYIPSVMVLGIGGTGSYVLTHLARLNQTLMLLGRPGIYVTAIDYDKVEEHNVGRGLFTIHDVGKNKAKCFIEKLNRAFGTDWEYESKFEKTGIGNILISCVDNIKTRVDINDAYRKRAFKGLVDYNTQFYWIDTGNSQYNGQVFIHDVYNIDKFKKSITIVDLIKKNNSNLEDDNKPSCSAIESLASQSLNINAMIGILVNKVMEDIFDMGIDYNFLTVDIDNFVMNKQFIK